MEFGFYLIWFVHNLFDPCIVFSQRELTLNHVRYYAVARPSVVYLCTFVRPTQPVEIFGNVSAPFGTLAIR